MVAVAHRSWSFIRGSNRKALTGKVLVFWISGRLSEVVAHGGSTAVRIILLPGRGGHLGLIVMHLFKAATGLRDIHNWIKDERIIESVDVHVWHRDCEQNVYSKVRNGL